MANYNDNYRNSNQRNSGRDWENDFDQDRNRNFDNDFSDFNNQRNRNSGGRNDYNQFGDRNDRNNFGVESGWNNDRQNSRQDRSNNNDQNRWNTNDQSRWNNDQSNNLYGSDRGQQRQRNDRFGGSTYGGSDNYNSSRGNSGANYRNFDDNYNQGNNQDRGWWDRTKDEVSSWFGDDDAQRRRRQDDRQQGLHKGRGPKGYTRSDERIKEDINDRLSDDHHLDASEITVNVSSGEVVLTGTVERRDEKRHAEDLAESVSGVKNVENRIRVGSSSSTSTSNTDSSASTGVTGTGKVTSSGNFETKKS